MTASPVLAQVEPVLRERFAQAKADGKVPQDVPFRIVSVPNGADGWRNYCCADKAGEPIEGIAPYLAKPTICD